MDGWEKQPGYGFGRARGGIQMRTLLILLVLLVLAAGCAVVPAAPYDAYGPYYGPYYGGPVYTYGYYGPLYYHHDFDRGYRSDRGEWRHHG